MVTNGCHKSKYNSCVYYKGSDHYGVIYLLLHVDDMFIASKYKFDIDKLKNQLNGDFKIKDLGLGSARKNFIMEITRDIVASTLLLSQGKYIRMVLETFHMHDNKHFLTPLGYQFKLSVTQSYKAIR